MPTADEIFSPEETAQMRRALGQGKPQKTQRISASNLKWIIAIILIVGLIFVLSFYRPQISNAYESIKENAGKITRPITKLFSPQEIVSQYTQMWSSPSANAPETNKLSLEFLNAVNKTPLSVIAKITLKTDVGAVLKTQCYLDDKSIETSPREMAFSKSDLEQHSSVKCSNDAGGKTLSVKIETPSEVNSILETWIGEGENKGVLNSVMDHYSPYSLLVTTLDDQPLKDGQYPLLIKMKKEKGNALLKKIDSLKVSTVSSKIMISCPFGNQLSGDRKMLETYLANKENDAYIIECTMDISSSDKLEKSLIEADLSYTVEEEFKTTLALPTAA